MTIKDIVISQYVDIHHDGPKKVFSLLSETGNSAIHSNLILRSVSKEPSRVLILTAH